MPLTIRTGDDLALFKFDRDFVPEVEQNRVVHVTVQEFTVHIQLNGESVLFNRLCRRIDHQPNHKRFRVRVGRVYIILLSVERQQFDVGKTVWKPPERYFPVLDGFFSVKRHWLKSDLCFSIKVDAIIKSTVNYGTIDIPTAVVSSRPFSPVSVLVER